jgi:hypothetical protein
MPPDTKAKNPLPIKVLALSSGPLPVCPMSKFCQQANQELADGQTTGRKTEGAG